MTHREIIDESDVFIDVHKAIRRMTPAPRARVPKGRIVEEPPPAPNTSTDGEANGNAPTGQISTSQPRRSSGSVMQPPELRFTLKDNSNAPNQTVVKRGRDEVREHLKHLGPSNLASKPRQTRYQNVKIKAPGVSPTRSGMADSESARFSGELQRRSSEVASNKSGVDPRDQFSPLFTPKDGVQALRQTYGTIGDAATSPGKNPIFDSATESTNLLGNNETIYENGEESRRASLNSTLNRSNPTSSHSSEGRSPGHSKSSSLLSGPVRSGSITEQVINVNGVKKVVLQTTSSSSSETEKGVNNSSTSLDQQKKAETSTEALESEAGSSNASKKKRRRRKKKHDGQDPENAPLIPK